MEREKPSTGKFGLNFGIILGLVMVSIGVMTYVTGLALEGAQWPNVIYYIVFPIVIIYAISQYKKSNAHSLSLSEALQVGMAIAVVSALVFVVYGLIFHYIIDPDFNKLMIETARDKLLENPNMTEKTVEQSMEWVEKFSSPLFGFTIWVAFSAFFGLIYSLIGGLIMKNDN